MKRILILLSITFLFACSNSDSKPEYVEYYPISLSKIIINNIDWISINVDDATKSVIYGNQNEAQKKKITKEDVIIDLKSFVEFDINKAAWQKSYSIQKKGNTTQFTATESRLPLKYISVEGDLKSPSSIVIYFLNTNNLYQSSKLIRLIPKKEYSVFSIQDVKGMDADTLFVKTILNQQ